MNVAHIDPDADLLDGLRSAQPAALGAMMDRNLSRIHALAYVMLGDQALAEDVAQDAFLKLWQHAPKWETGQARILTWLRRVATNNCLDRLRKKGPIYSDSVPDRPDEAANSEQSLQTQQRAQAVRAALETLPPRQRAAVGLSFYQDASQKEGAEILGVSEKAYESLLMRAKRGLKAQLSPLKETGVL